MSFSEVTTHGRERKFSDAQLREDLIAGLKPAQIAQKWGVSASAVSQRIKKLEASTASAVAPHESRRFASSTIDAMEQLSRNLRVANKLQSACDEWLTDADDPEKYDIGPRADEVKVTYQQVQGDKVVKVKRALSELIHDSLVTAPDLVEVKHADPRELILKTAAEARQTISLCADLAKMLADIRGMQTFRELILLEIENADPDIADRIREGVRRSLSLQGVLDAPPDVRWSEVN
jgi:predicted transcriptional regulator